MDDDWIIVNFDKPPIKKMNIETTSNSPAASTTAVPARSTVPPAKDIWLGPNWGLVVRSKLTFKG